MPFSHRVFHLHHASLSQSTRAGHHVSVCEHQTTKPLILLPYDAPISVFADSPPPDSWAAIEGIADGFANQSHVFVPVHVVDDCMRLVDDDKKPGKSQQFITDMFASLSFRSGQ